MIRRSLLALAVIGLSFPVHAQSAADPPGTGNSVAVAAAITDSEQFVNLAAVSDFFEIQASAMALERSQDEAVKAFAQKMIDDHTANSERLVAAAAEAAVVTPATDVDILRAEMLNDLRNVSDTEFDATYVRLQIEAHDVAVALFTSFAEGGDNERLQAFAAETLPALQQHRQELDALVKP